MTKSTDSRTISFWFSCSYLSYFDDRCGAFFGAFAAAHAFFPVYDRPDSVTDRDSAQGADLGTASACYA